MSNERRFSGLLLLVSTTILAFAAMGVGREEAMIALASAGTGAAMVALTFAAPGQSRGPVIALGMVGAMTGAGAGLGLAFGGPGSALATISVVCTTLSLVAFGWSYAKPRPAVATAALLCCVLLVVASGIAQTSLPPLVSLLVAIVGLAQLLSRVLASPRA